MERRTTNKRRKTVSEVKTDVMNDAEAKDAAAEQAKKTELPGVGHNSGEVSGARLKSFIERVERLSEEKAAIAEDVKDVLLEAKATGFDTAIMKKIVSLRKQPLEKRREEGELIELYKAALNMED